MYSISYTDWRTGNQTLVGDSKAILSLAHMLEKQKIAFQVANVQGFRVSQSGFGVGGFEYWLEAIDK